MSVSAAGNVKVSARIRKFMPWEQNDICYEIDEQGRIGLPAKETHKTSLSGSRSTTMQFMKFDKVFDRDQKNVDVFDGTAKQLCDNMVSTGFNAMLIAYGQTGSGKTHTLLGNNKRGVQGILGLAVNYLLSQESVVSANMGVLAVYGIKQEKVEIFDLFDQQNVTDHWDAKKALKSGQMIKKDILNGNILELIELAQKAAHYAPTGKNPNSSRGHTAFIVEITMADGHRCDFLCMDLAGSEGMTAITPEFTKRVGQKTAHIRLMEGGAINFGLQQLQKILKQVGSKDGVSKVQGSGLRKLLHPYLQKDKSPMVEVLFTLSPSTTNLNSSRSTLRNAETTAGLKIVPVKIEKKKSHQQIIAELKKKVRNQEFEIEKLQKELAIFKNVSIAEDASVKNVQITYDSKDLCEKKTNLVQLKRQLTRKVEDISQKKVESQLTSDQLSERSELLSELKEELDDIDGEIDELDGNIAEMEELENEMDDAIAVDLKRNSKMYRRESALAGPSKLRLLGSFAVVHEEAEADGDDTDGFVKVSKQELLLLKEQLDTLAINMSNKKKEAKQRNADLLEFVDKLQNEQKELLLKLDSKRSS